MSLATVDLLIGKIVSVLENEASLIGGVSEELGEIQRELASMRSFLEDAESKRALTQGERAWVADVRDIVYKVENIIDNFMYHMNRQQPGGKFIKRLLYRTIHLPRDLWVKRQMAAELQKVNKAIKSIPERRQRYGVDRLEGKNGYDDRKWVQNRGESSLFIKDHELFGIEEDRQLLEGWLMDGEPQRTVISVVGMGGSGKTTLVARAYKSHIVKRHFDCHAWITVSQSFVIEDLFKSMIKEFHKSAEEAIPMDISTMSYRELLEMLVNYLQPKRYVIVLDDVWNSNLWRDMNVSLPDEGLGSRVMLTTRNENIAASAFGVKSHVHYIKPLGTKAAWDLFCMKAFSSNLDRSCPQELEIFARDLVGKCKGLPLAILALGCLMSSKKLEFEWRKVYDSLNWELSNNPMLEVVKAVLFLSFIDLPYQLKRCFLYCCAFPEDYRIERKRLIRLWMAEGFVEKVKGITPEEVADNYLMELIGRSMLQVEMRNDWERPKVCKMHDLMRELALSTSEAEGFCAVDDGQGASEHKGAHRLSIQITHDREIKSCKGASKLRSLFVFVADMISPSPSSLKTLLPGFRLLRVLDLEDVPIEKLPDGLTDLFNLRYLNLKGTMVKELPKSIGKLHNLQTLNIKD